MEKTPSSITGVMAGNEPQKQLLSLIRDFAAENSQGERRIGNLKKQTQQLTSAVNIENVELEEAKSRKETIEQEFKGYEVEMAIIEASILALEARISSAQSEISAVESDLECLKNEGGAKRDDFIKQMSALNQDIRVFQASIATAQNKDYNRTGSTNGFCDDANGDGAEVCIIETENKIAEIISQTNLLEQEYETEQKVHEQVQKELSDLESKASLIEKIMIESREIQDLTRQISEQEEKCASIGDELQRRFLCPRCGQDNSESLDGVLQTI